MDQSTPLKSIITFLSRHAPFSQMSSTHREFLAKRLKLVFFAHDEIITGPDEGVARHFYIIKQGRVRGETQTGKNSDESAWELVTGESFPVGALLARRPARTYHRAVEDTFCYELDRNDFETLLQKSSVFHDFCTRRIANLLDHALREVQAETAANVSEDSSLSTPLRSLLSAKPISCNPDTPIRDALQRIENAQRRSIAIVDNQQFPIGILTLRDVMVRITLAQHSIDAPISEVMTPLKVTLSPDDFAYEAALQMAQSGIGHVCIVEKGRFLGLVSERDLFSLQRVGLGNLSRAIQRADSINTLKHLANDITHFAEQLMAQGASVIQLMRLITTLNDSITRRVIILSEAELGKPDVTYTWMAFGSEGREEQTLKTDQDNGIIFEVPQGRTADDVRKRLLPLAQHINQALDQLGFPLCPGNIMAGNPECCLSLDEWQQRFSRWMDAGTPEHLLKASIFFDFRSLFGDDTPVNTLREWLNQKVKPNSRFRRQMAENALRIRPPLGLFGDFVTSSKGEHANSFDLKLQGVTPFVDAARIIALANQIDETNTISRLKAASNSGALRDESASSWIEAYQYVQLLRMRNHYEQALKGEELSNYLEPDKLNELEQRILKESFRQSRKLQSKLALEYQL